MRFSFKEEILKTATRITKGEFKTYQEVAQRAGNSKAVRTTGNILAKNRNPKIPCHRVIKSNGLVGDYFGEKKLSWKKLALLLKEGVIAVMPTDTIYGICGSAFNKKTVEKIYRLRKRNPKKPVIVLIENLGELKKFGVKLSNYQKKFLSEVWPGKVSVILKCPFEKFAYLYRGTKTIAFRMPKNKELRNILKISGPLAAPSANWEGYPPAQNIKEAKKYFNSKVIYFNGGDIISKPSRLVGLTGKNIKILRY